jgi:hypothetical protein
MLGERAKARRVLIETSQGAADVVLEVGFGDARILKEAT